MGLSRHLDCVSFLIILFFTAVPAKTAEIFDLGTLGGTSSRATAVNDAGQVVGFSGVPDSFAAHGFLYSSGHMKDLGTIGGGAASAAYAINNSGEVVGQTDISSIPGYTGAFSFTSRQGMTQLGSLSSTSTNGVATGINDSGQIVGSAPNQQGATHAFLYTRGVGLMDLGTLNGITSTAAAINNKGQVVGTSGHAFVYTPGLGMVDLGTLGGDFSYAYAINNAGEIVGESFTPGYAAFDAFLYTPGAGMTDIGPFQANAINDAGEIVGLELGTGAVLYANGVVSDLNSLLPTDSGWHLDSATGINNKGEIVGFGEIGGETHAFLMDTAVPEPASIALLGMGVLALGLIRKRC
jgi:probable HAF family extracellular repeat protein